MSRAAVVVIAPLSRTWWGGPPPSEQPVDRVLVGRVVFGEGLTIREAEALTVLICHCLDAVAQTWPVGAAAIAAVVHGRWN